MKVAWKTTTPMGLYFKQERKKLRIGHYQVSRVLLCS